MIECIVKQELYEMANVSNQDTKLPYSIWIDSAGVNRNIPHYTPRIKVDVNGDLIPVSIDPTNPDILVKNKTIPKLNVVKDWIVKYYDVLIKHWNKEINDREALNSLND